MKTFVFLLSTSAILSQGACTVMDPDASRPDDVEIIDLEYQSDPCGARGYERFIGQQIDRELGVNNPKIRIYGPGEIITQDYRPDRVNIELDDTGTVTRVRCG